MRFVSAQYGHAYDSLAAAPQAAAADSAQEGALLLRRQVLQPQLIALGQTQQRRV